MHKRLQENQASVSELKILNDISMNTKFVLEAFWYRYNMPIWSKPRSQLMKNPIMSQRFH